MSTTLFFDFTVDKETNTIHVKRDFAAELPLVWDAYTRPEILDQWWAPKPWKTETKTMDFREGGHWHYAMLGPAGEVFWCFADYITIEPYKRYTGLDGWADESGHVDTKMPQSKWEAIFTDKGPLTQVEFNIVYPDLAQLEATIQMGFREGLALAMEGLDQVLTLMNK